MVRPASRDTQQARPSLFYAQLGAAWDLYQTKLPCAAMFAFLLVKQCLLSASEQLAECCLVKLILSLLIIPNLQ